jgi:membrane protease YdiL (CAAX protease family)
MSLAAERLDAARAPRWLQLGAVAAGCGAIAFDGPSYARLAAICVVGVLGAFGARDDEAPRARALAVAATGFAAFAIARAFEAPAGIATTRGGIAMLCLAAVAEEAFFRRYVYGFCARRGAAVAVCASAVLFALVHVPLYGWGAFGMDLAAGLVLGWQRWASGTWTAPAVTHVFANILQMG